MSDTADLSELKSEGEKYLLFDIGGELFGSPLLGVREVVEKQKIKPIPNTINHFLGVINIRGEIVGVTDLRIRLNVDPSGVGTESMVVFECAVGPIAALVDRVIAVISISDDDIDKNLGVESQFSNEYLTGVAKHNEKLVTIVDLNRILGSETLKQIKNSKLKEVV